MKILKLSRTYRNYLLLKGMDLSQGKHEIIRNAEGFKYSLKIVIDVEGDIITVITNYPLKKGEKK